MHGSPWRSWNANEMLHSRNMIMFLLNGLREMGWIMLCSADVSAKYYSDKNDSKLTDRYYSDKNDGKLTTCIY